MRCHEAKPEKPQGKALQKELVFQTAEGAALLFVFDQKQKTKKQNKNKIKQTLTGGRDPKPDA